MYSAKVREPAQEEFFPSLDSGDRPEEHGRWTVGESSSSWECLVSLPFVLVEDEESSWILENVCSGSCFGFCCLVFPTGLKWPENGSPVLWDYGSPSCYE